MSRAIYMSLNAFEVFKGLTTLNPFWTKTILERRKVMLAIK